MSTKPEGYAPDLFSEHARLAQLGARVLEIVGERESAIDNPREQEASKTAAVLVLYAARSLGLLDGKDEEGE